MATSKLSAIASGGVIAPTTDAFLVVRSGTTDLLVTPGSASAQTGLYAGVSTIALAVSLASNNVF